MGKVLLFLLIISLALTGPLCYSQTLVQVSDPRLEMVGNKIHIHYDIINTTPDSRYNISIVIKDEDGNLINANALEGDIGDDVPGGHNKEISWDLEADQVFIDAYILVQVHARLITQPVPAKPEETPEATQDDQAAVQKGDLGGTYNRTGIVLQSLAVPGLGLSRVKGKPHWLRGVAGYGCIAGAIILDRQAVNTYNSIKDLVSFNEVNEAYDKAVQLNTVSDILAFAAAGIWVTDLIWTLVGTSDLSKPSYLSESSGLSIRSNMDPLLHTPMLSVRYRF